MKHAIVAFAAVLALAANAQSAHQVVRLDDVILLAQEGLSDETILAFLDNREVDFALGPQEIVTLQDAGVSEEVIRYLIDRTTGGYSAPRSAYVAPSPLPYYSSGYAPYGYGAGYLGASIFPHWWYDHHHGHVDFGHHAFGDHHLSPHGQTMGHVGVHGFGHDAHAVPRGGHFSGHGAAVGAFRAHAVGHGGGHDGAGHFAVGQSFGHGFAGGGHAVGRGLGHGAAHGGQGGGHSGHGHSGGHSGGGHGGHH